jgi:hypothetical protein
LNDGGNYHALYKIDSTLVVLSGNETIEESVARSFRVILKKSENKNLSEMHIGKQHPHLMKLKIPMSALVKIIIK